MQVTWVWSLSWEDPLEKWMTTHSSILAWRIPWTEKPGGLQSMGDMDMTEWLTLSLSLSAPRAPSSLFAATEEIIFPSNGWNLKVTALGPNMLLCLWSEKKKKKSTPFPHGTSRAHPSPKPLNCLFGRKNTADPQQTLKIEDMQRDFLRLWEGFFLVPCSVIARRCLINMICSSC